MMSTNKKRKNSSCPFAGAKKAPKRKKSSKHLSKDRARDLAASDEGSYFEQEQGRLRNRKEQKGRNHGKNDWPNNCIREWSARKPCKISYLSFLSFRCDFARECFCEIRTWIVVYRELQKRQKQHLTPLVNYKCSIV